MGDDDMKLEPAKVKRFVPFNIVVESEEEAVALFHVFNNAIGIKIIDYCKNHDLDEDRVKRVKEEAWELINKEAEKRNLNIYDKLRR